MQRVLGAVRLSSARKSVCAPQAPAALPAAFAPPPRQVGNDLSPPADDGLVVAMVAASFQNMTRELAFFGAGGDPVICPDDVEAALSAVRLIGDRRVQNLGMEVGFARAALSQTVETSPCDSSSQSAKLWFLCWKSHAHIHVRSTCSLSQLRTLRGCRTLEINLPLLGMRPTGRRCYDGQSGGFAGALLAV